MGCGANLSGCDLSQPAFDFVRRKHPAVPKQLFANPIHLVFCAFLSKIDLAQHVTPRALQLRSRRSRLDKTLQFASNQVQGRSEEHTSELQSHSFISYAV